jgi:histidinol-phosphatase
MYEHELAFARGLADRADDIAMGLFRGDGLLVREKADATLVTQGDLEIETMVREQLAAAFPEDRILGEEEGGDYAGQGRIWILDPIDGTSNFARGVPIWATLLALHDEGTPVLGLASAPALGERYEAVTGAGARMNDRPIQVSDVATITEAQLLYELDELLAGRLRETTLALMNECWRNRAFGDFWAHMLVARGSAEAMIEPELAIWDYAALEVIVTEAGGRVTTFEGGSLRHGGSVLATNGALHDELVRRLSKA